MKLWIASFLISGFVSAVALCLVLAQISNNAVEDAVHSEFCCESHGGCPAGVIPECRVPRDNHWEYKWSDAFKSGIAGVVGFGILLILLFPIGKRRLCGFVIPGSVLIAFSLCLIGAQFYVWIWRMPLFD